MDIYHTEVGGAPETGPDCGADETAAIPTAAARSADRRLKFEKQTWR